MKQTFFEKRIKPILLYVGTIGAGLMSVGYIILMFILVLGFNAKASMTQSIVFAIVNALVGFVIMQFLKIQGVDFAKQIPENVEITKKYNCKKKKDKKHHSMKYFWAKSITGDAIGKALTVGLTTAGIIYIVVEGSQDYSLLLLGVVNLLMFACFGLISLVKAYDFYNDNYIPYIQERINEIEAEKHLEVVKEESNQQRDDLVHNSGRTDILESSGGNSITCTNSESVVLDNNECDNCVLGRSIDTSSTTSDSTNFGIKENPQEIESKDA